MAIWYTISPWIGLFPFEITWVSSSKFYKSFNLFSEEVLHFLSSKSIRDWFCCVTLTLSTTGWSHVLIFSHTFRCPCLLKRKMTLNVTTPFKMLYTETIILLDITVTYKWTGYIFMIHGGCNKLNLVSQLLYGMRVLIEVMDESFNQPILWFSCKICCAPSCISGVALRAELAKNSLEAYVWTSAFKLNHNIFNERKGILNLIRKTRYGAQEHGH